MTGDPQPAAAAWLERAADRSPSVQRSRQRSAERAQQIVDAARRLVVLKGSEFTTHELVKEAGIAVQTFYTHFEGKDQVLLAVFEELISETCAWLELAARDLPDPVSRLEFYVRSVVGGIDNGQGDRGSRFITTEHWRLHRLHPQELAQATSAFTDLLLPQIRAATAAGLLAPSNADHDAWLVTQLVIAVFHHYEYARSEESVEEIADRLWSFCYAALGGRADPGTRRPPRRA
ncbi:MAG TPA: TetR/AcrR family transcriptional regulator [Mycobacteriales bacterium]|nr:TetR/AcrR family transcriptional regulator [Mycobacteriales bacterium]